jgi:SSS family solute:Na+ symporter
VSLFTVKRDPKELVGLVFGLTPKPKAQARWYARPAVWACLAVAIAALLNVIFW